MSQARKTTTTTTEPPTTEVAIEEARKVPFSVILVVVGVVILIVICLCVVAFFYQKRKKQSALIAPSPDTPPEQLGLHPKSSLSSSPVMQQRVFSIDTEHGLSDVEGGKATLNKIKKEQPPIFSSSEVEDLPTRDKDMKSTSPDVEKGEMAEEKKPLSRTHSKGSFKALAVTARLGAAISKKRREQLAPKTDASADSISESDIDSELEEDSGYIDAKEKAKAALDALKGVKKERKKSILKDPSSVFTTAKKLYEGKQSTFKRTGGRCNSAGTQTTPSGSVISIPGLAETPEPDISAAYDKQVKLPDKDYFVYLVSDSSGASSFRKDCIGRVTLPAEKKHVSLDDLRKTLHKSEDVTIRNVLKASKQFRFVTETYRFVAQPEQSTNVSDIYINQGVYVKLDGAAINPDAILHTIPDAPSALSMASRVSQFGRRSPGTKLSPYPKRSRKHEKGSKSDEEEDPDKSKRSKWHVSTGHGPSGRRSNMAHHQDTVTTDSTLEHPFGDRSEYNIEQIQERLRQRHFECVSPSRLNYKDAYRKQAPADHFLILDGKRKCDNPGCHNRAIFKCARCIQTAYCSGRCKKENRLEHSSVCIRPPWRLGAA